jgi:DNA-binding CsgD family transcriptional regulator
MESVSLTPKEIISEGRSFIDFLGELQTHQETRQTVRRNQIQAYLDTVQLWNTQFVYIHDIPAGKFYHKGFAGCLGYDQETMTADFFVRNLHPDDRSMYFNVSKALLSFVMHFAADLIPFVSTCQVNYRLRKSDGSYCFVLRQSTPFLKDDQHTVEAYISFCTDISSIASSTQVRWQMFGPHSDEFPRFLANYLPSSSGLFSKRELDVLVLLEKGLSSQAISDQLCISQNTVNSHRKSMMKKADTSKTIDLLAYARANGLL